MDLTVPVALAKEWKKGSCEKCRSAESQARDCIQCDQLKLDAYQQRKAGELAQLSVDDWPEREGGEWQVRYYDSLQLGESPGCRLAASKLLALARTAGVQVSTTLPARCNKGEQVPSDDTTCGFWCLHYIEEECRRRRGEGTFSRPFDLEYREGRLTQILRVLV